MLLILPFLWVGLCSLGITQTRDARTRLQNAAMLAALDSPGLQPWHMKLDITLNHKGKPPEQGMVEVWAANGNMRAVETWSADQFTMLRIGGKLFVSGKDTPVTIEAAMVLQQILDPIPAAIFNAAGIKTENKGIQGTSLDCFEMMWPQIRDEVLITGQKPAYCLAKDSDMLLITYGDYGGYVRQRVGKFQGKVVPLELLFLMDKDVVTDAKVESLRTYVPQSGEFSPSAGVRPISEPVEVSSGMMQRLSVSYAALIYPQNMSGHGDIKYDVFIGVDGHVKSLQQIGKSYTATLNVDHDPDSTSLAPFEKYLNEFIYRPFTLIGVPVQVKTSFSMKFSDGTFDPTEH
jgi:hypothetical protein